MATKTYVLLESMDADAPVYQQTADGQRVQVKKIPFHRPTLRQEFQDEDGIGKVIRYKSASKFIDQNRQVEEEKLDANVPFTTTERNDLRFRFGILVTTKVRAQEFLEAHPECFGFKGTCDTVKEPVYKLLDEGAESKIKNSETKKRIKAASKVFDLELKEAQEMLIRLNGSFFETPKDLEECQNMLISFIDDAEDAGLDAVLKEKTEFNADESTTVLIGKLIKSKIISFDLMPDNIAKFSNDKWVAIKEISSDLPQDERKRIFADFLNSNAGESLLDNLVQSLNDVGEDSVEIKKKAGRPPKQE